MLDFWYPLGLSIMDPKILKKLIAPAIPGGPVFNAVNRQILENGVEVYPAGKPSISGFLNLPNTMLVRAALQKLVAPGGPKIPVSFGAAGKFVQLLALPAIGFASIMEQANEGFVECCVTSGLPANASTFSQMFPAFLGCAFIDANLAQDLGDGPGNDSDAVIDEFGIDPSLEKPDMKMISTLVNNGKFQNAQSALLSQAGWPTSCGAQRMAWSQPGNGGNARAILP